MNDTQSGGIRRWLKAMMLRHIRGMITCREFEEFVQAYVDDELPTRQRSVFEWHMRICRECREYLAAYKRSLELGKAILGAEDEPVPDTVPEDLVKAILSARKH